MKQLQVWSEGVMCDRDLKPQSMKTVVEDLSFDVCEIWWKLCLYVSDGNPKGTFVDPVFQPGVKNNPPSEEPFWRE
eukprot:UN26478